MRRPPSGRRPPPPVRSRRRRRRPAPPVAKRTKTSAAPSPKPAPTVVPTTAFDELGLREDTLRAIAELGFETPTPIQAMAIPALLTGRDLIGMAQTGTGKTAAFGLPLIEKMDASSPGKQALVLAPTRELAIQVAKGLHDFAKYGGLRVVPVYGGQTNRPSVCAGRAVATFDLTAFGSGAPIPCTTSPDTSRSTISRRIRERSHGN